MKIAVFGASGKTGKEAVIQALEKGYQVNAFVRDINKLSISNPELKVFTGDVLDLTTFGQVLMGVDAVLVTLNGIMEEGVKNILQNMRERHVKRIVHMSSYPMSGSQEGINYLKSTGVDEAKIKEMQPIFNDKKAQEELIFESGMTWTVVRPTFLDDNPKTGAYNTQDIQFNAVNRIARSDVAEFMLTMLTTDEWDNKLVSVSS